MGCAAYLGPRLFLIWREIGSDYYSLPSSNHSRIFSLVYSFRSTETELRSPCEPFRTQVDSPVSCFPTGDPHSVAVPLYHLHRSSHFFVNTGYDRRSSQQWWWPPFIGFAPALPPASKALQPIFHLLRSPLSCKPRVMLPSLQAYLTTSFRLLPPSSEWMALGLHHCYVTSYACLCFFSTQWGHWE